MAKSRGGALRGLERAPILQSQMIGRGSPQNARYEAFPMSKRFSLAALAAAIVFLSLQAFNGEPPLLSDQPAAIEQELH